jgi:uncharacterized protein (TIGR02145 family)
MKTLYILPLFLFCNISFSQEILSDISGNIYKTVKIGPQIWMAENLRTEKFNNGDPIEQITSNRFWQEVTLFGIDDTTLYESWPVMCFYNNEKQKNNALYNYYVVSDDRGVCPTSWHVPSAGEYTELIEYLGGMVKASTKLKSTTTWKINGTNSSGFNALGIGSRSGSGEFEYKNEQSGFWTDQIIKERNKYNNMLLLMGTVILINSENSETEIRGNTFNVGHAVRCIKN